MKKIIITLCLSLILIISLVSCGENDNKGNWNHIPFRKSEGLQNKIHRYHRHKAGKKIEDQGCIHIRLSEAEFQAARAIGNAENEKGAEDAGAYGNNEGVQKHP